MPAEPATTGPAQGGAGTHNEQEDRDAGNDGCIVARPVNAVGDPVDAFPYFLGYADETGEGDGEGLNANYPMPAGTPWEVWAAALADALKRIEAYGAEAIVVSLGVDTFEQDPISFF
ncbi:MAG: hypothetical protein IV103_11690, partial [Zoogloea sp.]|nr:hypothetical protein [Zoogloea sp.]